MDNFTSPKRIRRQYKGNTGRMRGGKLYPAMVHKIGQSESGVINQTLTVELDPIPGRLISEITAQLLTIYVPLQALDAIKDPAAAYAGMTEVVREKLLSGTPIMGLENEGEISKRAKVNPRSIGGAKKVNEAVRLAYNCAINMLRQRAYFRSTLLLHSNTAIAPAIYDQTVLDKINGVLDPDDRINGVVNLDLPTVNLPVTGAAFTATPSGAAGGTTMRQSGGLPDDTASAGEWLAANTNTYLKSSAPGTPATAKPDLNAIFSGVSAGGVALLDFYNAQAMDRFARSMDQTMRDNPQYGEEMVLRWAHGLSVDAGRMPFIIAERRVVINKALQSATDSAGVNDDVLRTDGAVRIGVTVPIPRTELGGIIITLVAVTPDEKLASQPEPFLSDVWTADNYVADSMALDPQAVTVRDLYSDCASGDETNVVAYTGLNALKEVYVDYGFSRQVNLSLVENKTAIWQIDVPLSVSPTNVNYPDYLDHGVFAYGGTEGAPADVATFTITSVQSSPTPLIVGPTPVEDIGVNNDNIFED